MVTSLKNIFTIKFTTGVTKPPEETVNGFFLSRLWFLKNGAAKIWWEPATEMV